MLSKGLVQKSHKCETQVLLQVYSTGQTQVYPNSLSHPPSGRIVRVDGATRPLRHEASDGMGRPTLNGMSRRGRPRPWGRWPVAGGRGRKGLKPTRGRALRGEAGPPW